MAISKVFTQVFSSYSEAKKWCTKIAKGGFSPYIFTAKGGYNVSVIATPLKNKVIAAVTFLKSIGLKAEIITSE